jgi:type 2 lantibiotic biosynthesis protein LanM
VKVSQMQAQATGPRALRERAALDIAARASNLAEQIAIVRALTSTADAADRPRPALSALDTWRLRRATGILARRPRGTPPPSPDAVAQLASLLGEHRRLQLRHGSLTAEERAAVAAAHAAWLPTYASALGALDSSPVGEPELVGAAAQRPWLAWACLPFLRLARRELEAAADEANARVGRELVRPALVTACEQQLVARLALPLTWAVEADQRVAFARLGIAPDAAGVDDHDGYVRRTFADAAACHEFYLRFPVLGRWLAVVTRQACDNGRRLMRRLARDADEIGRELMGEPIVAFTSADLGRSDFHAGGRSVAMIGVELASGPAGLVYKPRCVRSGVALRDLLRRLREDGVLGMTQPRVLAKDGYGYEQLIPSERNHVGSREQASRIYEELGGLLAIFYVLGGSDLHYENVIVADDHVHVCDCETVLGVAVPGQEPATGTVLDSVYRTGLLEWPLPPTADVVLRLSACAGGEAYAMPFPLPKLQEGPAPAVRYEDGVHVDESAANRVHLDGALLDARDFQPAIARGFCAVHDWFRRTPSCSELVASLFGQTEVRFVARNTQTYAQLSIVARHPRCLMDPLEVDAVLRRLAEQPLRWDEDGQAAASEMRSLWQLDIPRFAAPADGTQLAHDDDVLDIGLGRTPLRLAAERIATLSDDDRQRQLGYIAASLAGAEIRSETFVATALDYARLVGADLCELFEDPARPPHWSNMADDAEPDHIKGSLYYGSAGVALFLAYLDAIDPHQRWRSAARRALADALSHVPAGIGAFEGLSGQIYVLTHLSQLWDEPALLARAVDACRRVDAMIGDDVDLDVLNGSAGVIAVMLGLADACGEGMPTAHRCARHLLARAVAAQRGISWPFATPGHAIAHLTGFAHGAGGIGWALIALGARSGDREYVDAGRAAFAYESLHFDEDRRDWYDLRTSILEMTNGKRHFASAWCNGAAGIGLSRIASWEALGKADDALLEEAYTALAATMRSFAIVGNDTLCHGRSGNAELLLRVATARDEPAFQLEANSHAQAHWRRLAGSPDWPRADEGREPASGLMVGIAGIGMHFLRLAHPERVPSPLLLDPPPSIR